MEKRFGIKVKYITEINQLERLSEKEKVALQKVAERFDFQCNSYYLSLINFDDPNDPLRQVVIPRTEELEDWSDLDPSDEKNHHRQSKQYIKNSFYDITHLLIIHNQCNGVDIEVLMHCFFQRFDNRFRAIIKLKIFLVSN